MTGNPNDLLDGEIQPSSVPGSMMAEMAGEHKACLGPSLEPGGGRARPGGFWEGHAPRLHRV